MDCKRILICVILVSVICKKMYSQHKVETKIYTTKDFKSNQDPSLYIELSQIDFSNLLTLALQDKERIELYINQQNNWSFTLNELTTEFLPVYLSNSQANQSPRLVYDIPIRHYTGSLGINHEFDFHIVAVRNKFNLLFEDETHKIEISNFGDSNNFRDPDLFSIIKIDKRKKKEIGVNCPENHSVLPSITDKKDGYIRKSEDCKQVQFYIHADNHFLNQFDGDIDLVLAKIISSIALAKSDFDSNFNLDFNIKEIMLSTCAGCDFISNSTNAATVLSEFTTHVKEKQSVADISIFITGRTLDNLYVGLANHNSFCDPNSSAIVQNIYNSSWEQRVIISHEIGHIFGAVHDNSSPNIMSSSLLNSNQWTEGSTNTITNKVDNATCTVDCIESECTEISTFKIEEIENHSVIASWEYDSGQSVQIRITELATGQIIYSNTHSDNSVIFNDLKACQNYSIELTTLCNSQSEPQTIYTQVFSTQEEHLLSINQISISDCSEESFDLALNISHSFMGHQNIYVEVLNQNFLFRIDQFTESLTLNNLTVWDIQNAPISVSLDYNGEVKCLDLKFMDMPSPNCSWTYLEEFDNGYQASFWYSESSNTNFYEVPYIWRIEDADRTISNYAIGQNSQSLKTIDGSPMAVIDDDVLAFNSFTGTTHYYSPIFNLSDFTSATLSFDYLFHMFYEKGINQSSFSVEIKVINDWVTLFQPLETTCRWDNIWAADCITEASIDVSQYLSEDFQFRFSYSDGNNGKWTGMAAIDNVSIIAERSRHGCTDPSAINYDETADINIPSLCKYICSQEYLLVTDYPELTSIEDIDIIETNGNVTGQAELSSQSEIILSEGFNIELGKTFIANIKPCYPDE